jgi:hypothetical protein
MIPLSCFDSALWPYFASFVLFILSLCSADSQSFSFVFPQSSAITRKSRLFDVVYNASNNELVRTKTLVKSAIIQVDATPFRQWYEAHYGVEIGKKGEETAVTAAKKSYHVQKTVRFSPCFPTYLVFSVL